VTALASPSIESEEAPGCFRSLTRAKAVRFETLTEDQNPRRRDVVRLGAGGPVDPFTAARSPPCHRPFAVEGGHTHLMGRREENIKCPHCRTIWGANELAGVFKTRTLTSAEEAEYCSFEKR